MKTTQQLNNSTTSGERRARIVRELLAKPHPYGSRAWHRIVALTGYEGDRTNADWEKLITNNKEQYVDQIAH